MKILSALAFGLVLFVLAVRFADSAEDPKPLNMPAYSQEQIDAEIAALNAKADALVKEVEAHLNSPLVGDHFRGDAEAYK